MKSFYIVTNPSKDPDYIYTEKIRKYLSDNGKEYIYNAEASDVSNTGYCYTNADMVPDNVDCIIVLGGDGTLIQAARDLNHKDIPLLGVNIGTLGYLTDTDMNTVYDTLDNLFCDSYETDSRMMLDGKIYRGDRLIYRDMALNDVVICRKGILRIIDFDVYVNGEYLNAYSADGVIVSTATGSTAYSLSAGGPIIQPNARLIMITPICPHTLNQRSIIFGQDDEITIQMSNDKKLSDERVVTFDGENFCHVVKGDRIVITRSSRISKFIKTSKISFLERIRSKM